MHYSIYEGENYQAMAAIRSALYVPADSMRHIESATRLSVDSIILDLEDGVAPSAKLGARESLETTVEKLNHPDLWVRINQGETGIDDVSAILKISGIRGIWVAKAEAGKFLDSHFEALKSHPDLEIGLLIESALGYQQRAEMLAHPRVTRVQIGDYDFRADAGMASPATETDRDLDGVRVEIVLAAVANGVTDILAGVSADFTDLKAFEASTLRLAAMGFTSRACIHPTQAEIVQRVFTPSPEEIAWATEIVNRFEAELSNGRGAYRDEDGNMTDAATVRRARHVLSRAKP